MDKRRLAHIKKSPMFTAKYGCKCGATLLKRITDKDGVWFDLHCPKCKWKQGFRLCRK